MITLRVRTKDGMERLKVEATAPLAAVRELVSSQLGVPLEEQVRHARPFHTTHMRHFALAPIITRWLTAHDSSSRAPSKPGPLPRRVPLSALLTTLPSLRLSVWATAR